MEKKKDRHFVNLHLLVHVVLGEVAIKLPLKRFVPGWCFVEGKVKSLKVHLGNSFCFRLHIETNSAQEGAISCSKCPCNCSISITVSHQDGDIN
jgi:hypothetical protein